MLIEFFEKDIKRSQWNFEIIPNQMIKNQQENAI